MWSSPKTAYGVTNFLLGFQQKIRKEIFCSLSLTSCEEYNHVNAIQTERWVSTETKSGLQTRLSYHHGCCLLGHCLLVFLFQLRVSRKLFPELHHFSLVSLLQLRPHHICVQSSCLKLLLMPGFQLCKTLTKLVNYFNLLTQITELSCTFICFIYIGHCSNVSSAHSLISFAWCSTLGSKEKNHTNIVICMVYVCFSWTDFKRLNKGLLLTITCSPMQYQSLKNAKTGKARTCIQLADMDSSSAKSSNQDRKNWTGIVVY